MTFAIDTDSRRLTHRLRRRLATAVATTAMAAAATVVVARPAVAVGDTWTATAPMSIKRFGPAAVTALDGTIYVFGGDTGVESATEVEAYDPGTNTWTFTAPMPFQTSSEAAALGLNGKIYVMGGENGAPVKAAAAYDPTANTWQMLAPMPVGGAALAAATGPDGKIYTVGNAGSLLQAYDPVSNTWTTKAPMPTVRSNVSATVGLDGKIYVIGGRQGGGVPGVATVEAYDPASNTWTTKASMPTSRWGLGVATGLDGTIYALGGLGGDGNASTTFEAYDPSSDTWTTKTSMPTLRTALAAATGTDGRIYAIGGSVTDSSLTSTDLATVDAYTPGNAAPSVNAGADRSGFEGAPVSLDATVSDPDSAAVSAAWSYVPVLGVDAGAVCTFGNAAAVDTTVTCTDDGVYRVTLTADDGTNPPVSDGAFLTVANAAPTLTITGPAEGSLYRVGKPVTVTATFADAGSNDTHTCTLAWEDGSTTAGTVNDGAHTCTATHSYTAAGTDTITVTLADDDGGSAAATAGVIVYNPNGGVVTGVGTVSSPVDAYSGKPAAVGPAAFGFLATYPPGASVPISVTNFHFHAGGFTFCGMHAQWLVLSGAKAQYRGTGTVNGASGYTFLLTATDGGLFGPDRLRLKVWKTSSGQVIYDNRRGAPDTLAGADPPLITGGAIVVVP